MQRITLRTWRKTERIRLRQKHDVFGVVAAVNENCVTVWLDNGDTLNLEPFDADMRLELVPSCNDPRI